MTLQTRWHTPGNISVVTQIVPPTADIYTSQMSTISSKDFARTNAYYVLAFIASVLCSQKYFSSQTIDSLNSPIQSSDPQFFIQECKGSRSMGSPASIVNLNHCSSFIIFLIMSLHTFRYSAFLMVVARGTSRETSLGQIRGRITIS